MAKDEKVNVAVAYLDMTLVPWINSELLMRKKAFIKPVFQVMTGFTTTTTVRHFKNSYLCYQRLDVISQSVCVPQALST